MLKIKDDVDLKELEKFGFELNYSKHYGKCWCFNKELSCITYFIEIELDTREIHCLVSAIDDCYVFETGDLSVVLFDLIQAGLVEKIGE